MSARVSLKNLGYVCPELVFEPLMKKLYFALQTLTATHQTVLALSTLGVVAHPLFSVPKKRRTNTKELQLSFFCCSD
jgi:hypothetical protein